MPNTHDHFPAETQPPSSQIHFLDTDLSLWHQHTADLIANNTRVIVVHGAGSANGIPKDAAEHIRAILHSYTSNLITKGSPVAIMYHGDPHVPQRPDVGSVISNLIDSFEDEMPVTAIAVQTSDWYEPKGPGLPLTTSNGKPYKTYVFNKNIPEIGPDLQGRGLAHCALTQSANLLAYCNYEQIIVGAAGMITATQMLDLEQRAQRYRASELGPVEVTMLSAHINMDPALEAELLATAQSQPPTQRSIRAAQKITQRGNHPYGVFFDHDGRFTPMQGSYGHIRFQPAIIA